MGILKRRWPEGEAAIATSPLRSYYYAHDILKGRFPEGEAAIAQNPNYGYWYACDIIKGRWLECEEALSQSEHYQDLAQQYLEAFPEARLSWAIKGWIPFDTSAWGV